MISGEIRTEVDLDLTEIARETIREIGYDGFDPNFGADTVEVLERMDQQSPDIAQGVDAAQETREEGSDDDADQAGAGDQGMMFGYATAETEELMPLPIALAHRLAHRLAVVRKDGTLPYLRPDAKTQVTVRYRDDVPVEIERVLISTQHADGVDRDSTIRPDLIEQVISPVLPAELCDSERIAETMLVNPTGRFVVGGPVGDAGLTGRKIIVDTYGGMARHGGGAFSGKDPSKVDRSAAYAARHVAKNVVAAGLAERCEVQVAYAIGVAHPVSLMVETFGTGKLPTPRSHAWSKPSSTCAPAPSAATSTCTGRSTRRPPPTATSAATTRTSPGSGPTGPTPCATRPARPRRPPSSSASARRRPGCGRRRGGSGRARPCPAPPPG